MKKSVLLAFVLLVFGTPSMAKDIHFTTPLGQSDFRSLSKEAGAAISYRNMAPAEPLGLTGFDAGIEASAVDIKSDSTYWRAAFGNDAPSYLVVPRARVRKGLPLGIDIGGMYSWVPSSNIKLYGFELSKAILEGGVATPALGVRATYTRLTGVSDLELQTVGADASISKGFLFLTPYAGAGAVYVNSRAKGTLQTLSHLKTEDIWQPRFFGGLKVSPFPVLSFTAEAEYQVRPIYSLKVAVGF